jgi:cystathionine beta-lyase
LSSQFDTIIDRLGSNSVKWHKYPPDVLPLWVADMDFAAPEPVRQALLQVVEQGVFGYEAPNRELYETVAERMQSLYGWQVSPDSIIATPGVVPGFTVAASAFCSPGQGVLIQPPVYPPFLKVHQHTRLVLQEAPMSFEADEAALHYRLDFDAFEAAFHSGDTRTGMFLLCNPHNPTGAVYTSDELAHMAEICLRNDAFICSDEIHSELLLGGARHTPIATLDPEIADRTVTLVAPSKTFNIPGLATSFAIIPDPELFARFKGTIEGMAMHVNSLGQVAAHVAFSGECENWLIDLRSYLTANRDFLIDYIRSEFPAVRFTVPDATYLSWLDCTRLELPEGSQSPYKFFLENARVALNDGCEFGTGGDGFVRLNFGCPRATLREALERMKTALTAASAGETG